MTAALERRPDAELDAQLAGFSERLRTLRLHMGWTPEEAAARLGIPRRRYLAHEGGSWPRRYVDVLVGMAKMTGVSCDWLMTGAVPVVVRGEKRSNVPLLPGGEPVLKPCAA